MIQPRRRLSVHVAVATSVEPRGHPVNKVSKNFTPVDLIGHFVTSTDIEIMAGVEACLAIALYGRFDTFELLASGIFTA